MKILIVSDAWKPQLNGVVRTYEYLIPECEKAGHTVKVIGPSYFKWTIPLPGYREITLALFPYQLLKKIINDYAPDTIHIATEGPLGLATQKYCKKQGYPFSTCYHTQFPDYLRRRVEKIFKPFASLSFKWAKKRIVRFHNQSNILLVNTNSIKEQLEQWGVKTPMAELTRGVDEEFFYYQHEEAKNCFEYLKKPIALYVGRIAIEKNIEAFLSMPWDGTKVVVGHGPDKEMLEDKYPNAHFLGKKIGHELGDIYRDADVFVFPSTSETFGMVIIEAIACGLPIAAYPAPGPKDIITEDFLGTLDGDLSVAALKALKERENKQQRSAFIDQHYTWDTAASQFLDICEKTRIKL